MTPNDQLEQLDLADLGTAWCRPDSLAQKRTLQAAFSHQWGSLQTGAGGYIDLHMLAMFLHDRQIERNLVKRVGTVRDLVELKKVEYSAREVLAPARVMCFIGERDI